MADNPDPTDRKRYRSSPLEAEDVLLHARLIWNRDPWKARSVGKEEEAFRSMFGCGLLVFLSLWSMLETNDLLPDGGTIYHLLWTLMFMKTYAMQTVLCSLAGGVDKDTFMKWTWKFIEAIAMLEASVVRKKTDVIVYYCCLYTYNASFSTKIIWENRHKNDRGCLASIQDMSSVRKGLQSCRKPCICDNVLETDKKQSTRALSSGVF